VRSSPEARRLLARPLVGRMLTGLLTGRRVAGPRIEDAVRVAAELVSDGRLVALEHTPAPGDDAAAELGALIGEVHAAGLAADCELTLPVEQLGATIGELARTAAAAGLAVAVAGDVEVPGTTVVVPAGEPGAETRAREHTSGRVRLIEGPVIGRRGGAADLAFVRCLNVLMAGDGHPEIAASDRRLIAIAGERAAWNGRTADSWEYVMPYGVLTDEQHRLLAGGYAVRVAVPSGRGAAALVARRLGGRA
jgi:proline dehydrogenase